MASSLSQTHIGLTLPNLSPHHSCTVPVQEKGLAEPAISSIVSGNKMRVVTVNLHNQSVTFKLRLLQFSCRDENHFPPRQNKTSTTTAAAQCHLPDVTSPP